MRPILEKGGKRRLCGAVLWAFAGLAARAQDQTLDFSDLPGSYFFNNGGQRIGNLYSGVTFGPNVTGLSVSRFGGYNSAAYPPNSGDVAIWDATDAAITITLDSPVQAVGFWYVSLGPLSVSAFDENSNAVTSATGSANSDGKAGTAALLTVTGAGIVSVRIRGIPGMFVLSSFTFDASGGNNGQQRERKNEVKSQRSKGKSKSNY